MERGMAQKRKSTTKAANWQKDWQALGFNQMEIRNATQCLEGLGKEQVDSKRMVDNRRLGLRFMGQMQYS